MVVPVVVSRAHGCRDVQADAILVGDERREIQLHAIGHEGDALQSAQGIAGHDGHRELAAGPEVGARRFVVTRLGSARGLGIVHAFQGIDGQDHLSVAEGDRNVRERASRRRVREAAAAPEAAVEVTLDSAFARPPVPRAPLVTVPPVLPTPAPKVPVCGRSPRVRLETEVPWLLTLKFRPMLRAAVRLTSAMTTLSITC